MAFELALVTGASSGIGEALCDLLASKGISLIITGRNSDRLFEIAKRVGIKVNVRVIPCDLNDSNQRSQIVRIIHELTPNLVINNAGFGIYGDAILHETSSQINILKVNGQALLEFTLEAAKALKVKKKSGVILNVSSVVGCVPYCPAMAVYAASKAFVRSLSEALNVELEKENIYVLTSCPGQVESRFMERALLKDIKQKSRDFGVMSPKYAAEQIWWQIVKKKPVHVFNNYYRFGAFIGCTFIPFRWVARFLQARIKDRMKVVQ